MDQSLFSGSRRGTQGSKDEPELGKWEKHTKGIGKKLLEKFGFKGRLGANESGITSIVEVEKRPVGVGLGYGQPEIGLHIKPSNTSKYDDFDNEVDITTMPGYYKDENIALSMKSTSTTKKRKRKLVYEELIDDETTLSTVDIIDMTSSNYQHGLGNELLYNLESIETSMFFQITKKSKLLKDCKTRLENQIISRTLLEKEGASIDLKLKRIVGFRDLFEEAFEQCNRLKALIDGAITQKQSAVGYDRGMKVVLGTVSELILTYSDECLAFGVTDILVDLLDRFVFADRSDVRLCLERMILFLVSFDEIVVVRVDNHWNLDDPLSHPTLEDFVRQLKDWLGEKLIPSLRQIIFQTAFNDDSSDPVDGTWLTTWSDRCFDLHHCLSHYPFDEAFAKEANDLFADMVYPSLMRSLSDYPNLSGSEIPVPGIFQHLHRWFPTIQSFHRLMNSNDVLEKQLIKSVASWVGKYVNSLPSMTTFSVPLLESFQSLSFISESVFVKVLIGTILPRVIQELRSLDGVVFEGNGKFVSMIRTVTALRSFFQSPHYDALVAGEVISKWSRQAIQRDFRGLIDNKDTKESNQSIVIRVREEYRSLRQLFVPVSSVNDDKGLMIVLGGFHRFLKIFEGILTRSISIEELNQIETETNANNENYFTILQQLKETHIDQT